MPSSKEKEYAEQNDMLIDLPNLTYDALAAKHIAHIGTIFNT
jgi:hypothetical protein